LMWHVILVLLYTLDIRSEHLTACGQVCSEHMIVLTVVAYQPWKKLSHKYFSAMTVSIVWLSCSLVSITVISVNILWVDMHLERALESTIYCRYSKMFILIFVGIFRNFYQTVVEESAVSISVL
jgi:hypothetical protein